VPLFGFRIVAKSMQVHERATNSPRMSRPAATTKSPRNLRKSSRSSSSEGKSVDDKVEFDPYAQFTPAERKILEDQAAVPPLRKVTMGELFRQKPDSEGSGATEIHGPEVFLLSHRRDSRQPPSTTARGAPKQVQPSMRSNSKTVRATRHQARSRRTQSSATRATCDEERRRRTRSSTMKPGQDEHNEGRSRRTRARRTLARGHYPDQRVRDEAR
jgi:hypothetical protein